jgi:opacity protein-like surface antigen
MTVAGGQDDNILLGGSFADSGTLTPVDPRAKKRSTFGMASASLTYSLSKSRAAFGASFGSSAIYYPVLSRPILATHTGGVSGTLHLWSGATLSASETASYSPLYFLPTFPTAVDASTSAPVAVDGSLAVTVENHLIENTSAAFSQQLSKRVTLQFDGGYSRSISLSHLRDLSTISGGGGLTVGLLKGLDFQIGYRHFDARYSNAGHDEHFRSSTIDVGLAFNRALSLSRRTTLSFNTGTVAVTDGQQTRYSLTGGLNLNYEIGRSWATSVTYARNVGFAETFRQPIFLDSLNLHIGGLLGRRLNFHTDVGAQRGSIGFGINSEFHNYYGSTGLVTRVTRNIGIGVEYSYFQYGYAKGVELPVGLLSKASRQQIRAFLTLSEPLFTRSRRPNASR